MKRFLLFVVGWLIGLSPIPLIAQVPSDEAGVVTELVREAVEKLHTDAFRSDAKAVIYQKALQALGAELGDGVKMSDRDLSQLSDVEAETAFQQALQAVAATPGQRLSLRNLAERSLQAYCKQHDPYTRYICADDAELVQLMNKATGSGIGMSINEKKEAIYCYPMPGSPAEAAGIKNGDKLLSVDGKSLEKKSLEYVASLIRGAPGTEVSLRVEHGFGRIQSVKIKREALTTPTVLVQKKVSGYVLRVRKFSNELLKEAREALGAMTQGSTLTLDLRGCPGGDLDAAIRFTEMFLDSGEPIVTVRMRGRPDEINTANKAREFSPAAIILLQDEGTASAAEMVIAALVNSPIAHAASQGSKTYGKGVMQTRIELKGGGVLMLTSGELIAPQGRTWDGVGLVPSLENLGQVFAR
ncbi:hypothetical protein BH11VER1_BH11VER1_35320 [soil metagenome]